MAIIKMTQGCVIFCAIKSAVRRWRNGKTIDIDAIRRDMGK